MVSMGRAMDRQGQALRRPDLKLFIKDVRDRQQRKRAITVRSWSTIQEVKNVIQKIMHVPPNAQRLYFGPLLSSGGELPNHRTLHDAGIYRSGETLLLDIKVSNSFAPDGTLNSCGGNDICISSSMIDSTPKALRSIVQKARRGFQVGLKPSLFLDGTGGSYAMFDPRKKKIGVFKPADEEPYAENNPRGYIRQAGQPLSLREGVVPGEACMREVAAFLLDHDGFSGVPMTTLVEAHHPAFNNNGSHLNVAQGGASIGSHSIRSPGAGSAHTKKKKVGSFQEFVDSECTMDDISPSKISVNELHKIAILDIRIGNADRNAANILVRRRRDNSLELIPIDHGLSLRSVADISWMDWCWLDWPQLKQPLSDESKRYILNLDIEADARMLIEQLNICTAAVDYFRASSKMLKAGVQAGLTLYEIAIQICRNDDLGELPSKLEMLYSMAQDLSLSALENEKWHHTAASLALAEQLSPQGESLLSEQWRNLELSRNNRMHKAASSTNFKTVMWDTSADEDSKKPGFVQSSASDSSLEAGDTMNEKDECDEWAAKLLSNIRIDTSLSVLRTGENSSVSSKDDSDDVSGSPVGFWQTRPGSPSVYSHDDESWNLSPESSPIHAVDLALPTAFHNIPLPEAPLSGVGAKRATVVHFQEDAWMNKELEVPSNDDVAPGLLNAPLAPIKREAGGMQRSQSYSAISALDAPTCEKSLTHSWKQGGRYWDPCTKEYEQFRDYFLKFVDLVIVRETRALTARLHR